jgi:hypothetical protein
LVGRQEYFGQEALFPSIMNMEVAVFVLINKELLTNFADCNAFNFRAKQFKKSA